MSHTKIKMLSGWLLPRLAFLVISTFVANTGLAGIAFTGDVSPTDPGSWNSSTDGLYREQRRWHGDDQFCRHPGFTVRLPWLQFRLGGRGDGGRIPARRGPTADYLYVGYYGTGTLNITNGGTVASATGYLGYNSGSAGVATVDGTGSTWTSNSGLTSAILVPGR